MNAIDLVNLTHISIRKSKWRQWKRCPKLYEYNWVLNLQPEAGVEQQFGTLFHGAAKAFFDVVEDKEMLKCEHAIDAYNYFKTIFSPEHPVVGKWVDTFLRWEANQWDYFKAAASDPIKFWRPLEAELEMFSRPVGYEMHIDRIDRLADGNLITIEYKCEKYVNLSDLRQESTFYSIGENASGRFDERVTMWGYFNPLLGRAIAEPIKSRTVSLVNRQVLICRRGIASGVFTPRPQRFCRYCPHNFRCLEAGVFDKDFIA